MKARNAAAATHGEHDDGARFEPVVELAAVEDDFEAAERQRDEQEAQPIDFQSAGEAFAALALEDFRLVDQPMHQRQRGRSRSAR